MIKRCFFRSIAVFLIITTLLGMAACNKDSAKRQSKEENESKKKQYIMFMFTNKHYEEVEGYLPEMKQLYGEINPQSDRMYAFGLVGPMLLTQSIEQMQAEIHSGFDYAEKYNIPVYFQLDDVTNNSKHYGSDAAVKFYEHPEMCEWTMFPEAGETYGGEKKYGKLPRYWFNWSVWMSSPAFPCLESPDFRSLISENMKKGVLEPLMERYEALKKAGKEYLFAGMAIGWETHIPDNSPQNGILRFDPANPPKNIVTGEIMEEWEMNQYGYAALHYRGYNQEKLEKEAKEKGKSVRGYMNSILYDVIHDFSEFMAKQAYDAGVPRQKIFTHMVSLSTARVTETTFAPPTWSAVNSYSTPGFTMSPVTCPYDINTLQQEIQKADPEMKSFACTEGYASGLEDEEKATAYFNEMFSNGAVLVAAFGYTDMGSRLFEFKRTPDFGYNKAVIQWLANK